ncbi:hypothetical protein [Pareuzebyella sediminis]|uniref:hypothetical protein n=1 Tax=Pareuzebyella sediminis TaxID=2607998 RepID=UPI001E35A457|nr:hypothetical protein [Pareuzebyella sediminis]
MMILSCIEDQDFGQYDEISVTPTVEGSMLYIEAPEYLINQSDPSDVISRNFNFEAFSNDLFAERVIDGTITYIIENTTSKELRVIAELLDDNGNVLDTEILPVDPAPMTEYQRDIFYGSSGKSIDIIKNTSSIRVTATNLGDTTSTSDLPEPKVVLKSSGKFRVRLK